MMNKVIQCTVYPVNKTGSDWHGNSNKTVHSRSMKIASEHPKYVQNTGTQMFNWKLLDASNVMEMNIVFALMCWALNLQ